MGGWGVVMNGHAGGKLWWAHCEIGRDRGTDWVVELRKDVEERWYTMVIKIL